MRLLPCIERGHEDRAAQRPFWVRDIRCGAASVPERFQGLRPLHIGARRLANVLGEAQASETPQKRRAPMAGVADDKQSPPVAVYLSSPRQGEVAVSELVSTGYQLCFLTREHTQIGALLKPHPLQSDGRCMMQLW